MDDDPTRELAAVRVPAGEQVAVLRPRTLPRLVMVFGLAVLLAALSAYGGAWMAYQHANRHTDQRIATLEADLQQRRTARAQLDAQQRAQLEQLRRDACVLADRVQPRDQTVEDLRARWGCTTDPTPAPSGVPPPTSRPGTRGSGGGRPVPSPAPRPPQLVPSSFAPSPPTRPNPVLGCVDLPLLPELCV